MVDAIFSSMTTAPAQGRAIPSEAPADPRGMRIRHSGVVPVPCKCENGPLASQMVYALLSKLFPQQIRRRSGRIAFTHDRDQCAVASVDNPQTQLDKVQIQTIELVFGEDNALDDATADGRDKLVATAMVQQFEKNVLESLTAARTEVQIIETDGY
jgi:hypothetical protein